MAQAIVGSSKAGREVCTVVRPADERDEDVTLRATALAHDLRVPLAAAAGQAELLVRSAGARLSEEEQATMASLLNTIARMDALIDRTLLRLHEDGRASGPVDVDALVAEVLADLGDLLAQVGAEVHVGNLGTVRGDEVQLRRVFQNVISNAVRYRHPRRRLVVRVEAHDVGDERHYVVSDNGLGFAGATDHREDLDRLGLGLRICRRIMGQHGGRVWVDPCGHGAVVRLALPRSGA